jgi:hypothetical protein
MSASHEERAPAFGLPIGARGGSRAHAASAHAWWWITATFAMTLGIGILSSRYLFWDSYLDLAGGRYVAHHGIPHSEVWTTAAHRGWIDQQWLAHLAYYGAWRVAGYPAVALLSSLLIASSFGGLAWALTTRGVTAHRAFMWTLLAFAGCMGNTVIRAQSFAYPLFVALGCVLVMTPRRAFARLVPIPLLLVLWGNLHGTVLLGAGLTIAWSGWRIVESRRARDGRGALAYGTLGVTSALAVFANPYGFSIVHYYSSLIGNHAISAYIVEWAPPSLSNPLSSVFFVIAAIAIGSVAYAVRKGARPQISAAVGATLLGLLAATGARYQAWFVIAAVFAAASALALVKSPPQLGARAQRLAAGLAVGFALVTVVVVARTPDSTFERLSPQPEMAATAAYARDHPQARILADENSSSALLWQFPATQGKVGFDARLEQYPNAALRHWFEFLFMSSPNWLDATRGYDVIVVTRSVHPQLARRLLSLKGWRVLAVSDKGVAIVRLAK